MAEHATEGPLAPEETPLEREKRRSLRHSVLLSGQLSVGLSTFDCTVVDLSEVGAQVDFAIPVPLPEFVTLRVKNGSAYPARCRWVRGTRTGLEFTGAGFNVLRAFRDGHVVEGVRLLHAERFFDDEEVRQAAANLELALSRINTVLRPYTAAPEIAKAVLNTS